MIQPHGGIPLPPDSSKLVYDDGEPMETVRHRAQMNLLADSLEWSWQHRFDFFVGGNMALYFSETQAKNNDFRAPDVFVVMNTHRHERKGWVVWDENGQTPDVIVELLSPSTEHVDRNEKMRVYSRILHIPEYFLFDPFSKVLEGYELAVQSLDYVRKSPEPDGRLHSKRLGLRLGTVRGTFKDIDTEWLRWIDADGHVLEHECEAARRLVKQANAELERANAEAERAKTEAERAKTEAERAKIEAERAKIEAERAKTEAERANAEAERAKVAEERADRLQAELDALKNR